MNWQEFNDQVRVFLIVDSERKGRGVQENIDSLIVASVVDLQGMFLRLGKTNINFILNLA